jgi:hypothetical protein
VKIRLVTIGSTLGWLLIGASGEAARGDGGTVRLSRCEGGLQISVFTAPTPFRAGPVDISVLVQDAITGAPIPEARITVKLSPRDQSVLPICLAATSDAATNKLLKAAVLELPEPGRWEVEVAIEGGQRVGRVRFELEAAGRAPQWPVIWPWIGWPAPVILLFSIHQLLVWRKSRPFR